MNALDEIWTQRLQLAKVRASDLDELCRLHREPKVMAALGGVCSAAQAGQFVWQQMAHWEQYGFGWWTAREAGSGKFVGCGGLRCAVVQGKQEVDSEGMALLADGTRLVSLEQHHRILAYPAKGGVPKLAPAPDFKFPPNGGMEALDAEPSAGRDAYVTAAEDTGETWTCKLSGGCAQGAKIDKPAEFGVVATRGLPSGRRAWLLRAWDPVRGSRIIISVIADPRTKPRVLDSFTLAAPYTRDNFEGLALVTSPSGGVRLFILADDNFSSSERTLMMAFDWMPSR